MATLTVNIDVTVNVNGTCQWTYQLDTDDARRPSVLMVARCLNTSLCEPVYSNVTVQRLDSTTGQMRQLHQPVAVACRLRSGQPATSHAGDYDDYDDE